MEGLREGGRLPAQAHHALSHAEPRIRYHEQQIQVAIPRWEVGGRQDEEGRGFLVRRELALGGKPWGAFASPIHRAEELVSGDRRPNGSDSGPALALQDTLAAASG